MESTEFEARARWSRTWESARATEPPGLFDELVAAYGEPQRAYHTMRHLEECFAQLDRSGIEPDDRDSLELALWFHDAIYEPRASDNEARSAAWAKTALASLDARTLARIEKLILVTKHDAAPSTADEELLLDVDLSILGAGEDRFAEYEEQIRFEYAWVPADAYREGRSRILKQFLDRPVLYHTTIFRDALESKARANLRRSLGRLAV